MLRNGGNKSGLSFLPPLLLAHVVPQVALLRKALGFTGIQEVLENMLMVGLGYGMVEYIILG